MPLAGESGQVPLSTEPIQGNARVFYSLVFLSPIPRDVRELKGPGLEKPRSLQIPLCLGKLQPDKSCPHTRQILHLCSADAADITLQGDCNSWHSLKINPQLPARAPRREIKGGSVGTGRGHGIPTAGCTWQPCQGL